MASDVMKKCIILGVCTLISACMVGADFKKPVSSLHSLKGWRHPSDDVASQVSSRAMDQQWWQLFGDPTLVLLIQKAVNNNLDIHLAMSRLEQSLIAGRVAESGLLPRLGMAGRYDRKRFSERGELDPSGNNGKKSYNAWQAGLTTAWELDIWGKVRRQVEVANAHVEMAESDLHAMQLAIITETASCYIQLRGIQATLNITQENLVIAKKALELSSVRFQEGVSTQLDVEQASTQIASTSAQLPVLASEESRLINQLSWLLGEPPFALVTLLNQSSSIPKPPAQIPIGFPSALAERRPDIIKATASLHASIAEVGVAKANFYPSISLTGNFNFQALQLNNMGYWDARTFNLGPSLYLPIFEGGRLTSTLALKKEQAKAQAILYQKTVLTAWHEIENTLTHYYRVQQQQKLLNEAVKHSKQALIYAGQQYKEGTTDYLHVLSTQKTLLNNQQTQVESLMNVSLALVDIYKALGGGWR